MMRTTKQFDHMTDKAKRNNEYAVLTAIRMAGLTTMIILFLILSFLSGCQKERFEVTDTSGDSLITAETEVAELVKKVATNDGSDDNILDGSSCLSLVFPIEVLINGEKIAIHNHKEFDELEDLLEIYLEDNVDVKINFPIQVVLNNHTEVTIASKAELEKYQEQCEEGKDDDIECIDFVYPLTISVYNVDNQVSNVITIEKDVELYVLFDRLDDNELLSLDFPVRLVTYDSVQISVHNNTELRDLIRKYEDACDEDDDNDFDDDDVDDTAFVRQLIANDWAVSSYEIDGVASGTLEGYVLIFTEDGDVFAKNAISTIEGEWDTYGGSGVLKLEIDFEDHLSLKILNYRWELESYTSEKIALIYHDNEITIKLVLEKF